MSKEERHLQTKIRMFEDILLRTKNPSQVDNIQMELTRMADTLNKAFGFSDAEKEKKKSLSSPARYGMSLKKFRRESFIKQYSYRPIARKHLPYHA